MSLTKIDDRGLKTPIDLQDNEKIRFGTGNDLEIYHDSSNGNSHINESGSGSLVIKATNTIINSSTDEQMIAAYADGGVELYHDNEKKLNTTAGGVLVTGDFSTSGSGTGSITSNEHINIPSDSGQLRLGASYDLKIYHDGSHSYIDNNTGSLRFRDAGGAEKFRISGSGTQFNDDITLSNDNDKINLGASNDLQIFHSTFGNNNISSVNGNLYLNATATEVGILIKQNDAVELYYNNSKKFETTSDGVEVSGGIRDADFLRIGTTSTSGISGSADDLIIGSIGDSTARGITLATTSHGAIRWADAGDNAMGRIQYDNSTDVMTLHTSNATRLRLDSDGMKFGSDSAAANALDDYEEGTFTPDWRGGSALGTTSYGTTNSASYTKIGRLVTVTGRTDITSSSGGSGFWFCTNMPFNVNSGGKGFNAVGSVSLESTNFADDTTYVIATMEQNNNNMHLHTVRDNATLGTGVSPSNGAMTVQWTITYQTA